jgi:hypothetical protein
MTGSDGNARRSRWFRLRHLLLGGGAEGNERLTATTSVVLLVLLVAEGITILRIGQLLTWHEFLGMVLIPPVTLKLSSTGYRFFSYYRGRKPYVAKGPPTLLFRVLVAPVLVLTTTVVFATGVALLLLHQHHGFLVTIHKLSFIVWGVAFALHVLVYALRVPRTLRREWRERRSARSLRYGIVVASVVLGIVLALGTVPSTDHWRDHNLPHRLDVD